MNKDLSFQEKMSLHIQQSKNTLPSTSASAVEIGDKLIEQEFKLFEYNGGTERPKYLQLLHEGLNSIPPTSVEPERSFSATGLFSTKIRSRLGDDSLNALLFLRQYFNRENKQ